MFAVRVITVTEQREDFLMFLNTPVLPTPGCTIQGPREHGFLRRKTFRVVLIDFKTDRTPNSDPRKHHVDCIDILVEEVTE